MDLHHQRFDYLANYLHSILTHIPQAVLFIDLQGIITTYNPAAERILERDPLDVLFTPFWSYFPDDFFGFSLRKALRNHTCPDALYLSLQVPSGKKREVSIQTKFLLNTKEKALPEESTEGLIVMLRDLTEMERLQTEASRASRMKELGSQAALLAHEIRNPLSSMKGFADLLKKDLADRPEQQRLASYITEGVDTLNRFVTNILSYARPIHAALKPCDLAVFLKGMKEELTLHYPKHHIELIIPETCQLLIDPLLFKSALNNLILNSVQAMPNGGILSFRLKDEPEYAELKISDTGTGISHDNMANLFTPFFSTKPDGNGLGLTEVQKVIDAHGGSIEAASELGLGTTFTIKIPKRTL